MGAFEDSVKFNFLYVDKYRFGRTWVYQESVIPYSLLRYIVEGSGEFDIAGEKYIIKKGQIAYIPERSLMSCKALEDNFTFISIRFSTSVFFEGADFLTQYYGIPKIIEGDQQLKHYFYETYESIQKQDMSRMLRMHGNLELIIASIIEKTSRQKPEVERNIRTYEKNVFSLEEIRRRAKTQDLMEDPRIRVVIDYIVSHPTEKYTSNQLSIMSGLAETTFRRLFKKQTGKSPIQFIKEIRLTTAARLLLVTDDNINDIAYEVGFEDANYFIRLFKKAFGMTPRQYRFTAHEFR
ncbi:AraC family transcriptional regulator [Vallitaleaceae bacterium 9-2]